jgi:hypothetical protein
MSKKKNKNNKAATPKELITRRDLCERIYVLQQEVNTLRHINTSLTNLADFHKNTSQKALKVANDLKEANDWHAKRARHYRTTTSIALLALILTGILHLVNIFF